MHQLLRKLSQELFFHSPKEAKEVFKLANETKVDLNRFNFGPDLLRGINERNKLWPPKQQWDLLTDYLQKLSDEEIERLIGKYPLQNHLEFERVQESSPKRQRYKKIKILRDYLLNNDAEYLKFKDLMIESLPLEDKMESYYEHFRKNIKAVMQTLAIDKFNYQEIFDYVKKVHAPTIQIALEDDEFMRYFLARETGDQGEIDWRPTETLPEDYYAL